MAWPPGHGATRPAADRRNANRQAGRWLSRAEPLVGRVHRGACRGAAVRPARGPHRDRQQLGGVPRAVRPTTHLRSCRGASFIRANLSGTDTCTAAGITARASTLHSCAEALAHRHRLGFRPAARGLPRRGADSAGLLDLISCFAAIRHWPAGSRCTDLPGGLASLNREFFLPLSRHRRVGLTGRGKQEGARPWSTYGSAGL